MIIILSSLRCQYHNLHDLSQLYRPDGRKRNIALSNYHTVLKDSWFE